MKPETAVRIDRTVGWLVYPFHRVLYQLSGGRMGTKSPQGPMLLLTTTGRRTGKLRTNPLLYMPDGDDVVVVASNGGRPEPPAWLLNLRADPSCSVRIGRTTYRANGEVLDGPAKAAIWPKVIAFYGGWAYYETLTDREIPAVVLRPSGD